MAAKITPPPPDRGYTCILCYHGYTLFLRRSVLSDQGRRCPLDLIHSRSSILNMNYRYLLYIQLILTEMLMNMYALKCVTEKLKMLWHKPN